jgi:hypothetical protein
MSNFGWLAVFRVVKGSPNMFPQVSRCLIGWQWFALAGLLCCASAQGAPVKKKKAAPEKKAEPQESAPAVPQRKPPAAGAVPAVDVSSPWRVWSDTQGRNLEAEFCALQGRVCTVRTREGAVYRLSLDLLVPADRVFAAAYASKLAAGRFKDEYVKKAAYQIDYHIGSNLVKRGLKFNPPVGEEVFLKRIYLDTIGRIPTADEAAAFLDDTAPDKRSRLIDALLESPGYTMHMYAWLAEMLRIKDEYGKRAPAYLFQDWLKDQLAADRPWDAMVREMLTADGKLCENGASGLLLRDAQMPLDGVSNLLTTFLGANVACAQCHDHPLASWTQKDFYQMAAFFGATDGYDEAGFRTGRKELGKVAGRGPVYQRGLAVVEANMFRLEDLAAQKLAYPKDYKYDDAKPGGTVLPQLITWTPQQKNLPIYRINASNPAELRNEFARWMTHPDNPRFATAIANRLWKRIFGLAVQEPVTDLDDPKKASNPELLGHITQIMRAARFDLRQFQRVLFNSQTYQRAASPAPDLEKGPYLFPGPLVRRLTAEQTWDSILVLTAGPDIDRTILRRGGRSQLMAIPSKHPSAKEIQEVAQRLDSERKSGSDPGNAVLAGYEGPKPQKRQGLLLARASELPQPAPETHFLRLFGESDRLVADTNTTDGSVPQALMLLNGPVGAWVSAPESVAVARAAKASTPAGKADSLYLSFLGRRPLDWEKEAASAALGNGLSEGDLAWTLLNTREFLFTE